MDSATPSPESWEWKNISTLVDQVITMCGRYPSDFPQARTDAHNKCMEARVWKNHYFKGSVIFTKVRAEVRAADCMARYQGKDFMISFPSVCLLIVAHMVPRFKVSEEDNIYILMDEHHLFARTPAALVNHHRLSGATIFEIQCPPGLRSAHFGKPKATSTQIDFIPGWVTVADIQVEMPPPFSNLTIVCQKLQRLESMIVEYGWEEKPIRDVNTEKAKSVLTAVDCLNNLSNQIMDSYLELSERLYLDAILIKRVAEVIELTETIPDRFPSTSLDPLVDSRMG